MYRMSERRVVYMGVYGYMRLGYISMYVFRFKYVVSISSKHHSNMWTLDYINTQEIINFILDTTSHWPLEPLRRPIPVLIVVLLDVEAPG